MYAHVNGVDLFFDVEGAGYVPEGATYREKPVMFVLHGGPGCDHTYFRPWLHPLAEHVQLVFLDHRGNGRSSRTDEATYTIEQMADDVEALRQYLGLGRILVLGQSFGGMVAQVYVTRYPASVSRLILANTTPSMQFWEEAQEAADVMATPEQLAAIPRLFNGEITSQQDFDEWWEVCMPLYFHRKEEPAVATAIEEVEARMTGAFEVANYMMANIIPKYDVRPLLPDVTAPTLVLAGRYDWVTPLTQSQLIDELVPNSTLAVFEDSGHMPHIEENGKFLAAVTEFVTAR
jgi:proline iminopeptidase